jgi:hypothetical protein
MLEEMEVETTRAQEDWYGERSLAVRRHGWPKKWTQDNSGSWQKSAAARGWSRRQELCQGSKKTLYEALRQTLELEVVKLGLQKINCDINLPPMSSTSRVQCHWGYYKNVVWAASLYQDYCKARWNYNR